MAKEVSREQAARKKEQAASFTDRLGEGDRAAEFDSMSVDEYAAHKGLTLTNPRRNCFMPNNTPTKSDLQDTLDQIQDILETVYTPESSRGDLAAAVGDVLDQLARPEEEEDEDSDSDSDEDNGD